MGDTLVQTEANTAASSPEAGSPIDTESVTIEQLDQLFQTGKAELPVKGGGESQEKPGAATQAGEQPQKLAGEIQESKTPEQIEADKTAAEEAIRAQGASGATGPNEPEGATGASGATGPNEPTAGPTGAAEATGATGPTEDEEEVKRIQRPRLKDENDQAVMAVYLAAKNSGKPITFAEAERRVLGDVQEQRETAAEPDLMQTVATLEGEVAEIKRKLTAAGADEGVYSPEIAQLNIELAEKVADLKMSQRDVLDAQEAAREVAEEVNTTWRQAASESRSRAIEAYPDVADKSTPLGKAVANTIDAMRDPSHPDHNLLYAASAAETIAAREAQKLGVAPVVKQVQAPAAKKVVAPVVPKMVPVSGVKSSASDNRPEDSKKKVIDYVRSDEASLQDLDAFQGVGEPSEKMKPLLAGVR